MPNHDEAADLSFDKSVIPSVSLPVAKEVPQFTSNNQPPQLWATAQLLAATCKVPVEIVFHNYFSGHMYLVQSAIGPSCSEDVEKGLIQFWDLSLNKHMGQTYAIYVERSMSRFSQYCDWFANGYGIRVMWNDGTCSVNYYPDGTNSVIDPDFVSPNPTRIPFTNTNKEN